MIPLIVITELPILESIDQVEETLSLKHFAYKIIAAAAVSTLLGSISLVLVFPWYAVFTSMMYVSIRQTWLGWRDNLPKTTAEADANLVLSSNA